MSRIDDDPAVIRARAKARERAVAKLREQLDDLAAEIADARHTHTSTGAGVAYLAGRLDRIRQLAGGAAADAVDIARADDVTWDTIGEQLGMDRRNAHRKYGKGKTS